MNVRSARNRSQSAASTASTRTFVRPLGGTSSVDIQRNLMGKRKDYEADENLLRHVEGEGNGTNDDISVKSKDEG